jgi:hypothetical protein
MQIDGDHISGLRQRGIAVELRVVIALRAETVVFENLRRGKEGIPIDQQVDVPRDPLPQLAFGGLKQINRCLQHEGGDAARIEPIGRLRRFTLDQPVTPRVELIDVRQLRLDRLANGRLHAVSHQVCPDCRAHPVTVCGGQDQLPFAVRERRDRLSVHPVTEQFAHLEKRP